MPQRDRPVRVDSERALLNQGLFSVSFFSWHLRVRCLPDVFRPLPLEDALDIVLRQPNSHDEVRRQQGVLIKLVRAGLYTPARLEHLAQPGNGECLVNEFQELASRLNVSLAGLSQLDTVDALKYVETQFANSIVAATATTCALRNGSCVACYQNDVTTLTASIEVNRSPEDLAGVIDPQNWGKCSVIFDPQFPDNLYRVQEDGSGNPQLDGKGNPIPYQATPQPVPWTGLLYERAVPGPASFRNILHVKEFTVKADEVFLAYELHTGLSFTLGALSEDFSGLHQDSGTVQATPVVGDSSWTEIQATKVVRFIDLTKESTGSVDYGEFLNYLTPAILSQWLENIGLMNPCCGA